MGAIDTYARSLVMPTISALLSRHPQLYVSVQALPAAAIDQGLVENELDVGVSLSHLSHADVQQRTLCIERLARVRRSASRKVRKTASLREVATTIADDGLSRITAARWRRGKTFTPAKERFVEVLSRTIRSSGLDMPDNDSVRTSEPSRPAGTRKR
ncbi:LysR substrate-binding domain-containing protein [Burkholderia sp. HI2500]|uniref:LysR substrate-binding domain-containing protein n=1 Tax=Burkholderia sp. HI2500 TaxID=2015358 RepID=UPI000B7A7CDE|nr:hypothetical protein CFB45_36750 [Burkholderia sp. HI2500]